MPQYAPDEVDAEAVMRDGTVLRADVYRPSSAGPWPVLLVRSPYGKRDPDVLAVLDPSAAVRRGYLVVIQDTRGRHRSEGDWQPLLHERDDGYDTVRWAARLPGVDGRVGMYGPSYLGHTQWAALAAQPPELAAAVPEFTWSDPYDGLVARGGARELGLVTQWSLSLGYDVLSRRHRERPDELRRALALLGEAHDGLSALTYWELPSSDLPTLRRLRLPVPGRPDAPALPRVSDTHTRITAPTLVVAGWYDAFLQGCLDNHTRARDAGSPAQLIVGPWSHGNRSRHIGETDFGPGAGADRIGFDSELDDGVGGGGRSLLRRELDWLDHHLKPQQPARTTPAVLVFVMGTNLWRSLDHWPPPATDTPWYLRADGVLSATAPGADEPPDRFRHDPADPVPTCGGALLMTPEFPAGPLDQRAVEDRPDVLVYTSGPLAEPVEVIGRVRATITAVSTAPSTDWVVRLCDVDAHGVSRNVTDGVLRVEHAHAGPRAHVVDLWSTAHVFLPGHRIRVQVASSNFPRWDRNLGAPLRSTACGAAGIARQSVHHDAARPSWITLPVPATAAQARSQLTLGSEWA